MPGFAGAFSRREVLKLAGSTLRAGELAYMPVACQMPDDFIVGSANAYGSSKADGHPAKKQDEREVEAPLLQSKLSRQGGGSPQRVAPGLAGQPRSTGIKAVSRELHPLANLSSQRSTFESHHWNRSSDCSFSRKSRRTFQSRNAPLVEVNDRPASPTKKPKMNTSIARRHETASPPAKGTGTPARTSASKLDLGIRSPKRGDVSVKPGARTTIGSNAMRGASPSSNPGTVARAAAPVRFEPEEILPRPSRPEGSTLEGAVMRSSKNLADRKSVV